MTHCLLACLLPCIQSASPQPLSAPPLSLNSLQSFSLTTHGSLPPQPLCVTFPIHVTSSLCSNQLFLQCDLFLQPAFHCNLSHLVTSALERARSKCLVLCKQTKPPNSPQSDHFYGCSPLHLLQLNVFHSLIVLELPLKSCISHVPACPKWGGFFQQTKAEDSGLYYIHSILILLLRHGDSLVIISYWGDPKRA